MTKTRIIVVEDEIIVAENLRDNLNGLGYTVLDIATSGQEAIEKAKQLQPDLVLMDIMLEGKMDGIEAADKIRTQFNIPIIFVTAYADETILQRAKVTEPFGYILKPFNTRELFSNIEMALYKHKTEMELRQHRDHLEELVEERTAELREAHQRLQELDKMKDAFIASATHELRTPLTIIMTDLTLLEIKPSESEQYIKRLKRAAKRLTHIIEEMFYVAQFGQKSRKLDLNPIDLNALTAQIVADKISFAEEQGLELVFDQAPDLPQTQGDPILLEQVTEIILCNALNYTPREGRVRVSTGTEHREGKSWVYLSIADTGHGIPADEHPRLFDRFFRGEITLNMGVSGAGLGLFIAKDIVERHGGWIEVENQEEPNTGTTFSVWLPQDKID